MHKMFKAFYAEHVLSLEKLTDTTLSCAMCYVTRTMLPEKCF